MHVISDLTVAVAYFSIPAIIVAVLIRRRQMLQLRWLYVLFALFIFLCGLTHIIELVTLWKPIYYFQGIIKALTAAVSLATALLMIPLIPKILDLLTPKTKQSK